MTRAISLFPLLNSEITHKIGVRPSQCQFGYRVDNEYFPLAINSIDGQDLRSGVFRLSDDRNEWFADTHNLMLQVSYTIDNTDFLFGPMGVSANDSTIGLAVQWTSKDSNQCGTFKIGTIIKDGLSRKEFNASHIFDKGMLKGNVYFKTVVYIENPGQQSNNERHLAKISGVILGAIDEQTLVIDGNGSIFPIVEKSEPSQPLWWVVCDWTDPQVDKFDEDNVRICINRAHSSYDLIKTEEGIKSSPILMEIIASAIQIIVSKCMESESKEEILNGQNNEMGSIGQVVHYFITTFGWDINGPDKMALSIRQDLENRL